MRAITYYNYGIVDNLRLEEVDKPLPKEDEILVKIYASSINSWDWDMLQGKPFIVRIGGLFKPKFRILGVDIAGVVEAVGKNVQKFKIGDEVYGDISGSGWGGFAEYVCVSPDPLALKPTNLPFDEAACIPHAGVLALQGFRLHPGLKKGHKVLINGAGGGVGAIAIQLAKLLGAEVTAVDRADKLNMLQALGADHVIDYQKDDYTKIGEQYDLILDVVAKRSTFDYARALKPKGVFVMIGGKMSLVFSLLFMGPLISKFGNKKLRILAHKPNSDDLTYLNGLLESKEIEPVIDDLYQLEEVPEAMQHLANGNARGKLVVTM